MKKTLTLILLFAIANLLVAQQDKAYYALDGSKSRTKAKRDVVEELLVNEIEINLLKMDLQGHFPGNIQEDAVGLFRNTV